MYPVGSSSIGLFHKTFLHKPPPTPTRARTNTHARAHTHTRGRTRTHTHAHACTHTHAQERTRTHARTLTHTHNTTQHNTHTHTHTLYLLYLQDLIANQPRLIRLRYSQFPRTMALNKTYMARTMVWASLHPVLRLTSREEKNICGESVKRLSNCISAKFDRAIRPNTPAPGLH